MIANLLENQSNNDYKLLIIMIILLSNFPSNTVTIYGGVLRDIFSTKDINDIDMTIVFENHTEYNCDKKNFEDKFFEKLIEIFDKENLKINLINDKCEAEKIYSLDNNENINIIPLEINFKKGIFNFTNYQKKYVLSLCYNGKELLKFNIDLTFVSMEDKIKNKPNTSEESLFLTNENPEEWIRCLDYEDYYDYIKQKIQEKTKSTLENKNVNEIFNNCINNTIEIINIDTLDLKNIKRINKFIDLDWNIKPYNNLQELKHNISIIRFSSKSNEDRDEIIKFQNKINLGFKNYFNANISYSDELLSDNNSSGNNSSGNNSSGNNSSDNNSSGKIKSLNNIEFYESSDDSLEEEIY